uniref:Uncharacterized protein n=1 Tax=Arundo donax TaxID=35708 RepID=A0A0A9CIC9_ARUDO
MSTEGRIPGYRRAVVAVEPTAPPPPPADSPPRTPVGISAFCPIHGWTCVVLADDAGPSSAAPAVLSSPTLRSPTYSPVVADLASPTPPSPEQQLWPRPLTCIAGVHHRSSSRSPAGTNPCPPPHVGSSQPPPRPHPNLGPGPPWHISSTAEQPQWGPDPEWRGRRSAPE